MELQNMTPGRAGKVIHLHSWKKRKTRRPCNLCGKHFRLRTKFDRFCEECKHENELYRFSEWLSA